MKYMLLFSAPDEEVSSDGQPSAMDGQTMEQVMEWLQRNRVISRARL